MHNKRRARRLAMALVMVLLAAVCLPTGAEAAGFSDVNSSNWYYAAVNYVVGQGLFKGTSDTAFSPNVSMSRAMFVTVLGRYAGVDPAGWKSAGFTDVPSGAYYAGYAAWAKAAGVVSGTGNNKFSPDANITREQMCAMLNRFAAAMGLKLGQSGAVNTFPDSGQISSWAKADVDAMQRCGVIQGNANGKLNPLGSATRAEAATMLMRFAGAGSGGGTASPGEQPEPLDPNLLPDTPATRPGGSVAIQSSVIRAGILIKTKNIDTSVPSVTLACENGTGFAYGVMSGRQFSAVGSVDGANVTVTTSGTVFTLSDAAGNVVYTTEGALALHPVSSGKAVTRVNEGYKYFGDFELTQASGKPGYITVVNYVDVEDYVKGVVPFEFSNSWPAEVMKAAAIACRSYVMSYNWSIYGAYGMDIVTGSGTQIYRGRGISASESYFSASDAAVDATRGEYLTYNGKICVTCFSSCDGGQTLDSSAVYGTNYAYLAGKADPYEQAAKGDIAAAGGNYSAMVNASHRVGLSAWGAYAMGKYYNKSCEAILGFYYTGTSIQSGG